MKRLGDVALSVLIGLCVFTVIVGVGFLCERFLPAPAPLPKPLAVSLIVTVLAILCWWVGDSMRGRK